MVIFVNIEINLAFLCCSFYLCNDIRFVVMNKEITFDRFIRGLIAIAACVVVYLLINRLSGALLPFLVAWLFCYLVYPIVKFFQYKLGLKNRLLSITVVMLLLTALIVGVCFLVIPPVMQEFATLKEFVLNYIASEGNNATIPDVVNEFVHKHIDMVAVESYFSVERIGELVKGALPKIWSVVSQSFSVMWGLVAVFMFMVYVLFILKDYELLARGWVSLIPEKYRERVVRLAEDVEDSMSDYFRGQSLVALCVGVLFSIGFVIIDFPLAIGFGLFVGLLNIVPYLQTVALVPTVFLALVKATNTGGNFWWILMAAGIVFLVVQAIQETILIPRIMNKVTGLNPAVILLSLSIWGSLLGLVGMIIALPATSLLLSYYRRFLRKQEELEETSSGSV